MATWIKFVLIEEKPKTSIWSVQTIDGKIELGVVKWMPTWRQYCFYPEANTVFAGSCLSGIMDFLKSHNDLHKNKGNV